MRELETLGTGAGWSLSFMHSRSHIYLWYYMAKRKTVKKVEQPKPIVDEVPAPAPVTEKTSGPMSLFECMKRRREKE